MRAIGLDLLHLAAFSVLPPSGTSSDSTRQMLNRRFNNARGAGLHEAGLLVHATSWPHVPKVFTDTTQREYAKTARVLEAGLGIADSPFSLTALSYQLAEHMGGIRYSPRAWNRFNGTARAGTFLLAVSNLDARSVMCGHSRDGMVNER